MVLHMDITERGENDVDTSNALWNHLSKKRGLVTGLNIIFLSSSTNRINKGLKTVLVLNQ